MPKFLFSERTMSEEAKDPITAAIDGAEELHEGVDKTIDNPGAFFVPEVLKRLVTLKKDDRAAIEALRAQLKKAGRRVTPLDDAIAEECGDTGERGPKQSDILIELAQSAELFHSADGTGFTDLDINGHRDTWPIRTRGIRRRLTRRFYEATLAAPSSEALQSALNVPSQDPEWKEAVANIAADRRLNKKGAVAFIHRNNGEANLGTCEEGDTSFGRSFDLLDPDWEAKH
jgi:hypothetical protein